MPWAGNRYHLEAIQARRKRGEIYIRQGDQAWFVPATDGVFTPPGDGRPTVEASGVLLTVER